MSPSSDFRLCLGKIALQIDLRLGEAKILIKQLCGVHGLFENYFDFDGLQQADF